MKKLICALLSGVMVTANISYALAAEKFSDFSEENYDWAYDSVMQMVDRGYINGYEDGTFKPDNSVTRLEVLALFSRALGALDDENKGILNMAKEKYADILKPFGMSWGTDEICFLLYRDVLSTDDLTTYLKDKLKDEAMPRHEAAVIITKAMGGKSEATSTLGVALDFTDQKEIPTNALQYVKYVSDKGIMKGMEDGSFSPNSSVVRSQMAVMLSRVVDAMNYTFVSGKLSEIDLDGRIITLTDAEGNQSKYTYLNNVLMKVEGTETAVKQMIVGVDVTLTLSNNRVAFLDTFTSIPDEKISGIFSSRATAGNVTRIILKDPETGLSKTYECSPSVSVTYNGEPSTLVSFKPNDYVTGDLVNGVLENVYGETKEITISNAVVENITIEPDFTMTISHGKEEYDGQTYPIADDAKVTKNNVASDFSSLYVGDRVTLTLVYGIIQSVRATSSSKSIEGTIKSVNISSMPTIVVSVNGEEKEYAISNSIEIKINGNEGSLYDFRVGDSVKITLESETVTKISSTSAQSTSGELSGVITAVNSAYGFIKVSYTNSSGITVEETVYCKDTTTTVLNKDGQTKKIKDLAVGQNVTAHGTSSNGAFSAKIIIFG